MLTASWHLSILSSRNQGCQMVCFQTKNPNLGKIWRALEWKTLVYFIISNTYSTAIWHIVLPFGNLVVLWFIFPHFGKLCQEKFGKPAHNHKE
jgi:hypothetical protein